MTKKLYSLGFLLFAALGAIPLAQAQDTGGVLDMTGMGIYAEEEAVKEAAREPARSPRITPAASHAFTYTSTAALRQQTVREVARRLRATDLPAAHALEAQFGAGKSDYQTVYNKLLAGTAYRDNDAASALAVYFEMGYRIVHHLLADGAITPAQQQALQKQVAGLLAANRQLTATGAAASLGEQVKLQTVLLLGGWQAATQRGQQAAFSAHTAQQLQAAYHLDFDHLVITDQGLRRR